MKSNTKIQMPEKVKNIIETIQAAGFEAYAVGGCVRDSLLGRIPNDWDITTSAKPEEIKKLFKRTIDTGIEHGTVTVMLDKDGFEVTTYRVDGEYEDGRHPKEVSFTASLREDLRRRDFTINAMAYNEEEGLVDIFGGMDDLNAGIIRCVGDAKERFSEDALRMLRAIRFSAQLGYQIEKGTLDAIRKLAPNLQKISAERIQMEMTKLLVSPHPDYLRIAYETGVTKVFFPEWDRAMETMQNHPHHCYSVGEHILHSMTEVRADRILRFAMMLHDIAKPEALTVDSEGITHFYGHPEMSEKMGITIMRRLKMDNDTIHAVSRLVRYHDYGNDVIPDPRLTRRAIHKIGADIFPLLLEVKKADILSQSMYMREEKLNNLNAWRTCYEEVIAKEECVSLKMLAVNGQDLIAEGIRPGKGLGEILNTLLAMVIEEPEKNNKQYLLEEAKRLNQEF